MSSDLTSLLQVPSVDAPVVALLSSTSILGNPEEGLWPEQVLQRAHLGAAWAIKLGTTASFFNRAMLLWLCQLQDKLSPENLRLRQNLNKIVAAMQFSADATLNATRFMAKSLAS